MDEWSTYESNVQSYRSNMIASQSFLLAVDALFYGKNNFLVGACTVLALFQLWYIWYRIIRVRTTVVDFLRYCMENPNHNKSEIDGCSYKELRKIVQSIPSKQIKWTRVKLDVILPISFSVLWMIIFIVAIC